MKWHRWWAILAIIFLCMSWVASAEATTGIFTLKKRGWSFYPYVSYNQYYTNNLSREPKGQEDEDQIFVGRMGLHIVNPEALKLKSKISGGRRFIFDLDLYADWVLFKNLDRKGIRPALKLDLAYISGTGFGIKITDNFIVTEEPANNELTGLELRIDNTGELKLEYGVARWAVSVSYRNHLGEYFAFDYLDRMDHAITAVGYYKLSPMTRFLVEYSFGIIDYIASIKTRSDAKYYQGQGGIEWRMTPKIIVTAKAGYQARDYDIASRGDYDGWVGSLNVGWNLLSNVSSISFKVERRLVESAYQDNNYYESNGGQLSLSHRLGERWLFSLGGYWHYDTYPEATTEDGVTRRRKEQIWQIGTGIDYYLIRGMSVGAGYYHRERDSSFSKFNYEEDMVNIIKIAAVF